MLLLKISVQFRVVYVQRDAMGFQETMHGFAALEKVSVFIYSFIFVTEKVSIEKHETCRQSFVHTPHITNSVQ